MKDNLKTKIVSTKLYLKSKKNCERLAQKGNSSARMVVVKGTSPVGEWLYTPDCDPCSWTPHTASPCCVVSQNV